MADHVTGRPTFHGRLENIRYLRAALSTTCLAYDAADCETNSTPLDGACFCETITSIAFIRVDHALIVGPGSFSSVCGGITSRSCAE
jgi:hypothetical protein